MPGGFGRNSFVGWSQEAVWGTPGVPTKYAELVADEIEGIRERDPRPVFRDLDHREGNLYDRLFGVKGGFNIELNYIGYLRLFEHLFGDGSPTTVNLDAAVRWSHTFALQDTPMVGKGLSVHLNTDVDNGSTPQKRCAGFKLSEAMFSYAPDRNARAIWRGAGKEVDLVAASSPTFPAITEYVAGHQTTIQIDDADRGADEVEFTIGQNLDLEKRVLGSKNISEPVHGDQKREITGLLTADAVQADFSKFLAGTLFKLEVNSLGAVLGTGNYFMNWTFGKCLITGDPYKVESPGIVKAKIPFKVLKPTAGTMLALVISNNESAVA